MSSYNCGDIVSVKLTDNGVEEKSFGYAVIISGRGDKQKPANRHRLPYD